MKPKIPSVQITPEAVIAFCQKRGQKPTSAQAERWLSRQHKCIEGMMTSIIEDNLEEILDEACLRAYPDPRFDKQYRLVDGAIMDAAENYAQEIGQEHLGQSHTEADMIEMVRRMIDQKGIFAACIACSHEFGPHFEDFKNRKITHRTERVHIKSENGKITAEIIKTNRCEHGHDVFVPEKLRNFS